MSENERIEKILYFRQRKAIRKKNKIQYFLWFASKYHLPWVRSLTDAFKEKGEYPFIPCRDLALRYTDSRDREIAAFMGYAISPCDDYSVIVEAMDELGERPWEWFVNRGFVRLSVGDMQDLKTCGQRNWKIAQMFHSLHKLFSNSECATLGEAVLLTCKQTLTPLDQFLEMLFDDCKFSHKDDELHQLILVLSPADGIGLSLWAVSPPDIRCPLTRDVRDFLGYWWTNWWVDVTIIDCPGCFGLSDGDLYIASIAYARLRKLHPIECGAFEKSYSRWFAQGAIGDPRKWRMYQQSIEFVF